MQRFFLQRLWRLGQSWDNPLSIDGMIKGGSGTSTDTFLKLPRFVKNSKNGVNQLLVFCDASSVCYATTIYLRVLDGPIAETNLVFPRMRLVPVIVTMLFHSVQMILRMKWNICQK